MPSLSIKAAAPAKAPKRIRFGVTKAHAPVAAKITKQPQAPATEVGVVEHDGKRFYASRVCGEDALTLCVPSDKGILLRTTSQVVPTGQVKFSIMASPVVEDARIEPFEVRPEIELGEKMVIVKNEQNVIVDYRDVTVSGLASDFGEDRDGEYVVPGAFKESLTAFRKNPVMLVDHINSVHNIAGSFTQVREGADGLQVQGSVSNAPELRKLRFLIAEKHLRGFSIGGMMQFDRDQIVKVRLFEISLVAIPANPRTLLQGRSLDLDSAKKAFTII